MDESHRLIPMKENYNEELFNELYKRTTALRHTLATGIDHRRLGVDRAEILSRFDVKFIYTYNKYFDTQPERLLGYIINSLKTFKLKMVKSLYQAKNETYSNTIELGEEFDFINIIPDQSEPDNKTLFINLVRSFLEKNLSEDAAFILDIQLCPPTYILDRLNTPQSRISNKLLIEYLDWDNDKNAQGYISILKNEIQLAIEQAKEFFSYQKNWAVCLS